MKLIHVLFFFCLTVCGEPDKEEAAQPITKSEKDLYHDASTRLVNEFLDHNRVVSRGKNGEPANAGDSLIWSGIALYGLSCEMGDAIERQLIDEIVSTNGTLMRHPTLAADDGNLDGAMGLYFGVADRIARCPGSRDAWKEAIRLNLKYVDEHDLHLNPKSDSKLEKFFDYVLQLLAHKLDLRTKPTDDVKLLLGLEIGEWSRATIVAKKSCFRIHLGFLALKTVESLGETWPNIVKNNFCDVTRETQMPTVDHYCGRGDINEWLQKFKFDEWEYRHQRCGLWETPDAGDFRTPGLDFLVGSRLGYQ
jgi:hypothetical protein